jgi:TonB family protein
MSGIVYPQAPPPPRSPPPAPPPPPIWRPPPQPPPPAEIARNNWNWLRQPSQNEFDQYFPEEARRRGRGGQVSLRCIVQANGALVCYVQDQTSSGRGLGEAAMTLSRLYRMAPRDRAGLATAGRSLQLEFNFRVRD